LKTLQPHLKFISRTSLFSLAVIFCALYLLIAVLFALIYWKFQLIVSTQDGSFHTSFFTHLYVSFATQSTIGYGDFVPIGYGRLVVAIQAVVGLLIVSLGSAALVLNFLTPKQDSILFDDYLVFYPKERKFRFRYINRLPFSLLNSSISMRLRYKTNLPTSVVGRINIIPQMNMTSRIDSMIPIVSATHKIKNIINYRNLEPGQDIYLSPQDLNAKN